MINQIVGIDLAKTDDKSAVVIRINEREIKFVSCSVPSNNAQFLKMVEHYRRDIASRFSIPPSRLGTKTG